MYFFGGKNRLKYTFFEVILLSFFKLNPRINTGSVMTAEDAKILLISEIDPTIKPSHGFHS